MKKLILMVLSLVTLNTTLSARSWTDIDVTRDEYYVTVKGTTDGDGSSWDMAISCDEFSYVLPNAKKGATFHLAAGRYTPILDTSLVVPANGREASAAFLVRKPVTIIGGYPDKPKMGDVSDPSRYTTYMNADVEVNDVCKENTNTRTNTGDDLYSAMVVTLKEAGTCVLKGLTFVGGTTGYSHYFRATLEVSGIQDLETSVIVDSCQFENCTSALSMTRDDVKVSNSIFKNSNKALEFVLGNLSINSCTFENISFGTTLNSCYYFSATTPASLKMVNSTLKDIRGFSLGAITSTNQPKKSTCELINNTILVENSTASINLYDLNMSMIGNIIIAQTLTISNVDYNNFSSRYNIIKSDDPSEYKNNLSKTDILTESVNFLDGENTTDGYVFNLADNGGYTPTVKLKKQEANLDGQKKVLRFNDLGENVTVDQRGELRGRLKCMGAYEIPCETDYSKKLDNDTIQCGGKFRGIQYDLPGVYDTIYVTYENRFGCDSIVPFRLSVMPKTFLKEYFVKENGKGDGSDWDHAMGVETFDFMLRNVPDGTKFYIAEGEYQPVRNAQGNVDGSDIRYHRFYTEKLVSLYGGFPSTAKGTDKSGSDPKNHVTLFNGDLGHNNPSTFSMENEYADFRKDDVGYVLQMPIKSAGNIEIKGITFANASQFSREGSYLVGIGFYYGEKKAINCVISECTFMQGDEGLSFTDLSGEIKDCYFVNNYRTAAYLSGYNVDTKRTVTRSTFGTNGYSLSVYGLFDITNCTFQSEGTVAFYSDADGVVANNTFMSDVELYNVSDVMFFGNIMNGAIKTTGDDVKFVSAYNLISAANEDLAIAKSDVKADSELILGVLDGTKPKDNGGYTPTIALKADVLSDGRSIRLPLSETAVKEDQRGVKRLDPTSMGAIEMGCTTKTKNATDTIVAGKSFLSKVYNKPGIYEGIVDTTEDANGCELIVTYTLVVKPNPSVKEYYVKVKGEGDGSNWDEAMNGADFAFVFSQVPDGTKFYLAEGEYQPIYNSRGAIPAEKDSLDKRFYTEKPVSLYGGFPDTATGTNKNSDPKKYITLFNGDLGHDNPSTFSKEDEYADFRKNDVGYILKMSLKSAGDIEIKGITFANARQYSREGSGLVGIGLYNDEKKAINCVISECTFSQGDGGLSIGDLSGEIKDCYFVNNYYTAFSLYNYNGNKITVTRSTFESNERYPLTVSGEFNVNNCTFTEGAVVFYSDASGVMANNTIMNDVLLNVGSDVKFVGNILNGVITADGSLTTSYNLISAANEELAISKTDVKADSVIIVGVLDGTKPKDNGGFTSTIALLSDTLSDGRSIRLPLAETTVTEDQRGVKRLDPTSMGAVEMGCTTIKKSVVDTIVAGKSFLSKVYNKPGIYEGIVDTTEDANGCELIVTHKLVVKPNPSVKEYYVKVKGEGDGSNWDEAMNGADFAFVFSQVPDGTKFYLAEGEYQPVYDRYGKIPAEKDSLSKRFYTEKLVSLYGGFPDTATGTNKNSDPKKYITLFSGDMGHDNPSTFSAENQYADFRKNDLGFILQMSVKSAGDIEIKGITFAHACQTTKEGSCAVEIMGSSTEEVNCTVSECTIYQAEMGMFIYNCVTEIKDCSFKNNYNNALYVSTLDKHDLTVTRSTFEENESYSLSLGCPFNVNNCTFQSQGAVSIASSASGIMANNTIMSDVTVMSSDAKFVGNILNGAITTIGENAKFTSSYNLISAANEELAISKTDVKADSVIIVGVLDGTKPKDNGGFTSTIALLSDTLSDGRSIRLPLAETTVTEDQRGVKRLDPTSMGAVEMGCVSRETSVTDTIIAGETFLTKEYNKAGIYEGVVDTTEDANGCELIVTHKLVVKPNPSVKEYYVKVKGEGDGSNWDEAMNGADFAFVFSQVPDGTKFYLAEGEYQPVYDRYGKIPAEKDSLSKRFYTEKLVSLYGGFPDTATGTNKNSDPKKYITLFSGDMGHDNPSTFSAENQYADFRKNDLGFILQMSVKSAGDIEIKGITFAHACQTTKEGSCAVEIMGSSTEEVNCTVSECTIYQAEMGMFIYNCVTEIKDCSFKNNYNNALYVSTLDKHDLTVTRSTFEENESYSLSLGCPFNVNNCTFQSQGAVSIASSASGIMANNTIMSDVTVMSSDAKFVGNILNGAITTIGENAKFTSSYNLISAANEELAISKTDVKADSVIIVGVLDGTKPKDNGGFTSTIALLSDTLSDGRSIRLPLAETTVTEDQRGVKRLDPTSMGAVEMGCVSRETSVTDTIIAGETFLTKEYNKAGIYEGVVDTTEDANGCELIITHKLVVIPNPSVKEYYVKENGEGDGSDWDHAMGVKTFDFMLQNVPDGTNFYIAEGEYQPVSDGNGNDPDDATEKKFGTSKLVNLYGGFPRTATGTEKNSDPKKYVTLFSGDLEHDNPLTYSEENQYADFRKNDTRFLLLISTGTAGDIEIKGITFSYTYQPPKQGSVMIHILNYGEGEVNCKLSECVISHGSYGLEIENCQTEISDCYFNDIDASALNINGKSSLTMTRSTFDDGSLGTWCPFNVSNCTFKSSTSITSDEDGLFANNTILGDVHVSGSDVKFVGNILNGVIRNDDKFTSSYNLISDANEGISIDKTDVKAAAELILDVLDQKGENTSDNGGFTPTIALLSDTLSDGRSIRLPLEETTVTEDQRGVARLEPTCMGAVEMGCVLRERSISDTIIAGDSFLSKVYKKAGVYENLMDTIQDINGCTIVTNYTLVVVPNPSMKEYYVKEKGEGDGSNWDDAMDVETFAFVLPRVSDGTKFYIAEGEYQPIYDMYGKIPAEKEAHSKSFYTEKVVSLYGGFPATATGTDMTNDSKKYQTVFSGDLGHDNPSKFDQENAYADFRKNDVSHLLYISSLSAGDIEIKGITFEHGYQSSNEGTVLVSIYNNSKGKLSCTMSECTFSQGDAAVLVINCETEVKDCYFKNNYSQALTLLNNSETDITVTRSTFEKGGSSTISGPFNMNNCTFLSSGPIWISTDASGIMANNTILSDVSIASSKVTFVGNIVSGKMSVIPTDGGSITSSYNLYSAQNEDLTISETDLKADENLLLGVFVKKGAQTSDNGGFTRTIALKTDTLSDGRSIRHPLTVTNVTEDQRGVARFEPTCMGAYELGCVSRETYKTDTIIAGKTFLSNVYKKAGVYKNVTDTIQDENGCDQIINYTLVVIPDPSVKEYYVKVNGTGAGSNWDEAINGADFAFILPLVPNGTKFYIAEGEYQPIYDEYGKNPKDSTTRRFYTEQIVSLYGGFPADAKGTEKKRDPKNHPTVFSGDLGHDNPTTFNMDDRSANFRKNDASYLLKIQTTSAGDIEIKGITFSHTAQTSREGTLAVSISNVGKGKVNCMISECTMTLLENGLFTSDCATEIKDCYFNNNYYQGAYIATTDNKSDLTVTRSTFENNGTTSLMISCPFNVNNCTFLSSGTISFNSDADGVMVNNTILNDLSVMSKNVKFVGNIVTGEIFKIGAGEVTSSYNLISTSNEEFEGTKTDIKADEETILGLLEDNGDQSSDNGGFTPTILLTNDKLPDGTSIRFPLSDTMVAKDQRGIERKEQTCMGACEIECVSETILTGRIDTIMSGLTYNGVVYPTAGTYELEDSVMNQGGCYDYIISKLVVIPFDIPTMFTPYNANGKNDIFMPGYEVYIYNVYGELITHSSNGWDGRYKDGLVMPDTYIYVLIVDGEQKKGTVTVAQ